MVAVVVLSTYNNMVLEVDAHYLAGLLNTSGQLVISFAW